MKKLMTPEKEQQLKVEIQRIHDRNGGDVQTLLRQADQFRKIVHLNGPQMAAALARSLYLFLRWGRGTGKTTMRGFRWSKIIQEMPRSVGLFIGPTYKDILTRIVPSLVQGLEMFGLYQKLHYFIGEQPPRSWRSYWGVPYQPPKRYDKGIWFFNGVFVHLISHDVSGDGRGLNADWADGDEAALLDPNALQQNTDPTLRGTNATAFKGSIYFGSRCYSSSMPLTPEGQWFNMYKEKARENPSRYTFIDASCLANIHNLRAGYLDEAREDAYAQWVYDAEYLNIEPRFSKDGFYPLLDANIHTYVSYNYDHYNEVGQTEDSRGDKDCIDGQPLILGVDWGASINCLTVNQHLLSLKEFRTLKSMYVLGDDKKIQDDLIDEFNEYYRYHRDTNNIIYLWYDATGNMATGNTRKTRAEQAQVRLQGYGWRVQLATLGVTNPQHEKKHMLWNMILKGDHPYLPRYRMNKSNCADLLISMRNAKTKTGPNGEIKKDKSSEKSKKIPRQHATDLSDANDAPIFGIFKRFLTASTVGLPDMKVTKT